MQRFVKLLLATALAAPLAVPDRLRSCVPRSRGSGRRIERERPVREIRVRGAERAALRPCLGLVVDPPIGLFHSAAQTDRWRPAENLVNQRIIAVAAAHSRWRQYFKGWRSPIA
jgi:hypothetical protein